MDLSLKHPIGIRTLLYTACLFLFAIFSTGEGPYSYIGIIALSLAAVIVVFHAKNLKELLREFGFRKIPVKRSYLLAVAVVAGGAMGLYHRNVLGASLPGWSLTGFAFVSVSIGFTEELLFRGYLQTQLEKMNIYLAVGMATVAHATYKVLIFASLQSFFHVDLFHLFLWTSLSGLPAGFLKIWSRSTLAPMLGHGAFDLVVYGDNAVTHGWVWA